MSRGLSTNEMSAKGNVIPACAGMTLLLLIDKLMTHKKTPARPGFFQRLLQQKLLGLIRAFINFFKLGINYIICSSFS